MASYDLSGKNALVTGSTSGIGKATAMMLADNGARVVVAGRDKERGMAVVDAIRSRGGEAEFIPADLHDAASAKELAHRAEETVGPIDILVNNAGIAAFGPTEDFPEETFDAIMATDVKAPFYLVSELAPAMAARGSGAVVNVSSVAGSIALANSAVYGASKSALNQLTRNWAAEYGRRGVRVNAVSPGPVRTPMSAEAGESVNELVEQTPAGYMAAPEQIAAAITYLASDESSYTQGTILDVDGGRRAV
ncbi:short-chain dehydrogenase [Acrocarpospora phusangensis]|uniref:Short-chain dehydrogenase n=1 Tax=Acrocarpospora phusangensis TaxID=1070424 RepID=A0A919Q7U8_9ACTN|nr:SDR family oxidoreductase [Acrocarpospora phusangensis]GIH22275.1 short-chain dehydrogenase [Acrocarpospora phusangensis]